MHQLLLSVLILITSKNLRINLRTGSGVCLVPKKEKADPADASIYIINFMSVQRMCVFEHHGNAHGIAGASAAKQWSHCLLLLIMLMSSCVFVLWQFIIVH